MSDLMSADDAGRPPERERLPVTVLAILHEVDAKLTALAANNRADTIDLRRFPFMFGELDILRDFLGDGEVRAEVDALGTTTIRETGTAGVWWISHGNTEGEIVAEALEICRCPELLITPEDDLGDGMIELRRRLSASA